MQAGVCNEVVVPEMVELLPKLLGVFSSMRRVFLPFGDDGKDIVPVLQVYELQTKNHSPTSNLSL